VALAAVANILDWMRDRQKPFSTLLAALCALLALGGCGSGTKVVTVSSAPQSATSESSTTTATTKTAPAPTKTTAPRSTGGPTRAPSTTRTAPTPAFTHTEGASGSAATAAAVVREHGYTANSTSDYRPEQTLTVLVGTRTGSGDGYDQQAFFFLDGKYIGTDTKQPSAQVKVLSQSDTEVTLAYSLYRPKDPLCCPSAGQAQVTFQLDNGKLTPLQSIPPASSSTLPSRL
jgi:hypothetical protein